MRGTTNSEQEGEDSEVEIVEVDPTGRYGRVCLFIFNLIILLNCC